MRMRLALPMLALACRALAACSNSTTELDPVALRSAALSGGNCDMTAPCSGTLVCVENAAGAGQNRCEPAHALYSFLELDPDGLQLAFEQVAGTWRTERAQTPLTAVQYPMQLASGEVVQCKDSDTATPHPCYVPDWQAYVDPSAIADKYDRFALFGLRPLRFLVAAWGHQTDAQLGSMARARGLSQSPVTIRSNMRNTYLAALDSFTVAAALPFAYVTDPAPTTSAGWLNPNAVFDPGLSLWDPASNVNCKTDKRVQAPGFEPLTYYDLRGSLWDRHATAFRALTFVNGYFHARGLLTQEQTTRWLATMKNLGDALALSSSFEPGANHGITEGAALLQMAEELDGVSAPQVAGTASLTSAWKELARQRLNDVTHDTMLPDGAQVEQSLFYHDYELSFLVEIQDWLRLHPDADLGAVDSNHYDVAACGDGSLFSNDIAPDPGLDLGTVVQAATRVATHTAMPSTDVPMLGSSPTASLNNFWQTSFGAYVAADPSDIVQQFQFMRTQGQSGLSIPLSQRMQSFQRSGYVTLRSAFAPSYGAQTHVLFNTGAPANAHAHLDALSVQLYAQNPNTEADDDGQLLLADSGWFSYTDPQRFYFESTKAHNTVTVDGLNQCSFDPAGKRQDPLFASPALGNCAVLGDGYPGTRGHLAGSLTDPSGLDRVLYQSAETSLYAGVTHRRGVAMLGRDVVLVLDQLKSDANHSYQQNWHLSSAVASIAPVRVSEDTAHYTFRDASGAPLFSGHFSDPTSSAFAASQGTCGTCSGNSCAGGACSDPRQGWLSSAENSKAPGWVLARQGSGTQVAWASAFLLGSLAGKSATVALTPIDGGDDYRLDLGLEDGLQTSLLISGFGSTAEATTVSYPLRGAFASYSFEADPNSTQDLSEGLAVSVSSPGETTDSVVSTAGVVGNAYQFISGGAKLASGGSFAFMHKPNTKFSLSLWLRMSSVNAGATGGTQGIFSTASWSTAGTGIQIYFQDDASRNNALRFVIRGNGGTLLSYSSPELFVPEDTSWHHYLLVFDASAPGDQVRLYRDGGNRTAAPFTGTLSTAANDAAPTIGKKPGTGVASPLHATIDELVVFKRALADADAATLYNGGAGLRAH